jgi:hypothetical protein
MGSYVEESWSLIQDRSVSPGPVHVHDARGRASVERVVLGRCLLDQDEFVFSLFEGEISQLVAACAVGQTFVPCSSSSQECAVEAKSSQRPRWAPSQDEKLAFALMLLLREDLTWF